MDDLDESQVTVATTTRMSPITCSCAAVVAAIEFGFAHVLHCIYMQVGKIQIYFVLNFLCLDIDLKEKHQPLGVWCGCERERERDEEVLLSCYVKSVSQSVAAAAYWLANSPAPLLQQRESVTAPQCSDGNLS